MNVPEGYRKLDVGERIKDSDMYWSLSGEWLDAKLMPDLTVLPDELWIRPIGPQTRTGEM